MAQSTDGTRQLAYGKHLSAECSGCHRIDGVDNGIPSITGWPVEAFVATIGFYREGARANPAMVSVAQSLEADQVSALAAYYGSLPKIPAKAGPGKK
jgi:cytochrome c